MLLKRSSSIGDTSGAPTVEKNRMINNLISFGYDYNLATLALKSTGFQSEDRAMAYINDRDPLTGRFEHPFLPLTSRSFLSNDQLCSICLHYESDHTLQLLQ